MIITKSEKTSQFIIETVAPIFNKNGYTGTSMSDITKATGLTKGAIYGNFQDKEDIAIQAFRYNIKRVISKISEELAQSDSPIEKLFLLTGFYRKYYQYTMDSGGCPILNVGIDANNTHVLLLNKVRNVIEKLEKSIENIIQEGIARKEIKKNIDPNIYAKRIFSMIEGSAFLSTTLKEKSYLIEMMNHIDHMIKTELKIKS
jgi:TetR/AcrR family transcriptional regulator, transcriptional repressor for nem operon